MNQYSQVPPDKDPELWQLAQKRASFKIHLLTYLAVNAFFWIIWFIKGRDTDDGWPWPVWPMLGWGVGLFFHYMGAYIYPKDNSVDREYEKLKKQKENRS
jgi:hypothetical protein